MAQYVPDGNTSYEPDLDNIVQALAGNGVLAGLQVTAQSAPNMTVQLAAQFSTLAGVGRYGSTLFQVAVVASQAIAAADPTNPRVDVVHMTSAGAIAVVTGTPAASPKPPALPSTSILLAYVSVAAAATNVQNSNISDRRLKLTNQVVSGTDAGKPTFGNTGLLYYATDTKILYRDSGAAWVAVAGALTTVSNTLGAPVTMTNANQYYDGPSVSLPAGTWLVSGQVNVNCPTNAHAIVAKMWDGTNTAYASAETWMTLTGVQGNYIIPLTPVVVVLGSTTTVKISCQSPAAGQIIKIAPANTLSLEGNTTSRIVAVKIG